MKSNGRKLERMGNEVFRGALRGYKRIPCELDFLLTVPTDCSPGEKRDGDYPC
ncbi:MAG TPA: hypothetical protein VHQ90_12345 [Thermoanaerobaculia bacterium]|nr:hypothetical protein [Thermoanaerobaculia bacterium]